MPVIKVFSNPQPIMKDSEGWFTYMSLNGSLKLLIRSLITVTKKIIIVTLLSCIFTKYGLT